MMKKILTGLLTMISFSAFAFIPMVKESNIELGLGYRSDHLKWTTGHKKIGNFSKEDWKDLRSVQLLVDGRMVLCNGFYTRGLADYGWIVDGTNTDKRFTDLEDGRKNVFSASFNKTDCSYVYDLSAGIGYQVSWCDDSLFFAPLVGYSYDAQHLWFKGSHIHHSVLPVDAYKRVSHFNSRWHGPWLGFDLDYRVSYELTLKGTYEYHWARYHGKGRRSESLALLKSFHQNANGYGNVVAIEAEYAIWNCFTVGLLADYEYWQTRSGRHRDHHHDVEGQDTSFRNRLNKVKWSTWSISATLGMNF